MKKHSSLRHLCMASALASSLWATHSHAALIAYEDFESYVAGSALNGQSGGTGFTGAWTSDPRSTVQAISITDPNNLVNGGSNALRMQLTANASTDIANAFSRTFAAETGTVYVSYLVRVESFEDNDFLAVINSNGAVGNNGDTLSTGVRNNGGNPIYSRVGGSSAPGDTDNVGSGAGSSVPDNTNFLVVAKYSKVGGSLTYNQTEVFVNPAGYFEPVRSAVSNSSQPTISQLSLLTGRFLGNEINDVAYVDSLRVATTFADAVGLTGPKLKEANIGAFADAHIQSGSNGGLNFANNATMQVKFGNNTTGTDFSRKAYIQFDVAALDLDALNSAALTLTVAAPAGGVDPGPTNWTFAVYGVRDDFVPGAGKLDENWAETSLNGNNAPGNNTTNGGAVIASDVFGGTFLSTFILSGAGVDGTVITLDDQAILDFLKSDTDGVVSFILVRTTQETLNVNSLVHAFYSSESTTGFGPRLIVSSIIPEPSVAILSLMGMAGLGLRRRRAH